MVTLGKDTDDLQTSLDLLEMYCHKWRLQANTDKKSKRKVQGVPQSQTAALPRHQEEEETDKTKPKL